MLLIRYYIFSVLFFTALNDIPKDSRIFIPPLKIPSILSSDFGELRIDHFHSGLDIKTQGVTGKEVVAAADGYIYRIGVSPTGFGNALYIKHPSGYSTVYGHLDRFTPAIEKYVRDRQYENKSFTVALFPGKDEFPVKQGELIAYSGNSGGSGGPHLHFEIRKSDSERPINPMLFDLGIGDNLKPVFEKLVIYPVNRHTSINNRNSVKKINVSGGHGSYFISKENEISVSGLAGLGIKAYDTMNESPNRFAVYSIELLIDSVSIYKYIMDGFPFTDSRYINSHIDYETFMRDNIYVERAFILPGDKLGVYKYSTNRGIFNFNDEKSHHCEIIISDASNNKSTLTFDIKSKKEQYSVPSEPKEENIVVMPYNTSNKFTAEDLSLSIPNGALYDTLNFSYKKEEGTNGMLSDLHYIHNIYSPLQKPYTLSIKARTIFPGMESKMLLIRLDSDMSKTAASSTWKDGYVTADLLSFGRYYIGIDTVPPVISANGFVQGTNLSGKKEIRIRIKDELSGIRSYEPSIDGKWALFAYDQKNDLLTYSFDESRIKKGTKHELILKVTDNKENTSTYKCNFTW
jgi:hypothetical protein